MIINLRIIVNLFLLKSLFYINFNSLQIKPGIAQTPETKDIIFKIPSQVAPNRRQSGSSRSGCPSMKNGSLTALIPKNSLGLTFSSHPTFFIYIPTARGFNKRQGIFTLEDKEGKIIHETKLPIPDKEGIFSYTLPKNNSIFLKTNTTYAWSFSLECKPGDSSSALSVLGYIEIIPKDDNLEAKLNKASPIKRASLYASAGIWHDALTTLAELRLANPNNIGLKLEWQNLLTSTELSFLAQAPFIKEQPIFNEDKRLIVAAKLFNQGTDLYNKNEFEKALKTWQEALQIYQNIPDKELEGKTISNIGLVYYSLGNYALAIEYLEKGVTIARQLNAKQFEGRTTANIGLTYDALGKIENAIKFYEKSLNLAEETNDLFGRAQILGNLGSSYFAQGNYNKAIDIQKQRLTIAQKINAPQIESATLNQLGLSYYAQGQFSQALDFYQQGLKKVKDRRGEAQILGNIGLVYIGKGKLKDAITYIKNSLQIIEKIRDRPGEGLALNNLGYALLENRNYQEAAEVLKNGINIWESVRRDLGNNDEFKVSVFEEQARTYRLLQRALIQQNKIDEALEISERGRARAFVELISKSLSQNYNIMTNSSHNNLTNSNNLNNSDFSINKVSSSSVPSISSIPQTIQDIKRIAKEQKATIVEYSIVSDQEIYIWVVQQTGEIKFRQSSLDLLKQNLEVFVERSRFIASGGRGVNSVVDSFVRGIRKEIGIKKINSQNIQLTGNPKCKGNNCLRQMHQLLIEPIADLLPTNPNARIIFIPQQSLFLVPFPALLDSNDKYLIEKHTILTSPAIQVLDLTKARKKTEGLIAGDKVLVVGNPEMPSLPTDVGKQPQQLEPLPGAEEEAKAIADIWLSKAILGKEATKATVLSKAKQAKIIHLATHGLLDDFGTGIPGAIALAPDKNDNGLLTANEIINLQLDADLVVLSACDTARGDIKGDGVIGLSRSLISAGARSAIVTLWAIPDEATSFLMTDFYRHFKKNPDKAASLRKAMLSTMKEFNHEPSAWAAFTLIGEAE
jgi:CHAT domain-containing protein/tetratricopeptide (TPR) repeat protein